jgi:hypothetical protein
MSKLFVYGDSWPFGAELDNCHTQCFPALLEKLCNFEVINKSAPATSIDHLVYFFLDDYENNLHNPGDKILFCLTGLSRAMCFVDNRPFELHPRGQTDYAKYYYKFIHSDSLEKFNLTRNVQLCNLLCQQKGLQDYFVFNWEQHIPIELKQKINFYNKTLAEILHPERNQQISFECTGDVFNESEFMHNYHPTALGHEKIAMELAKWIS